MRWRKNRNHGILICTYKPHIAEYSLYPTLAGFLFILFSIRQCRVDVVLIDALCWADAGRRWPRYIMKTLHHGQRPPHSSWPVSGESSSVSCRYSSTSGRKSWVRNKWSEWPPLVTTWPYSHACTCASVRERAGVRVWVYLCAWALSTCPWKCVCMRVPMHVYVVHGYASTYVCACVHTCLYVRMLVCARDVCAVK